METEKHALCLAQSLTFKYCRSLILHEQTRSYHNGSRKTLLVTGVTVEEYAQ